MRFRSFATSAAGATAIEYGLIAALFCGVSIPAYRMLAPKLKQAVLTHLAPARGEGIFFGTEEQPRERPVQSRSVLPEEALAAAKRNAFRANMHSGSAIRTDGRLDESAQVRER
ncbi:Flp family type IVb pilin [Methylobacterium organophilum]|uniref:Flp family type IVb pilin n=1 Tax=Methylobacterium organophilum TaxID=410 RepID=UPI001F14173A|nr:Flp family type IVb pilin [Methylobacterium organophilum]UMY17309.1 Flp family type IVb pilin [Methylobacterium organophilum]